MPSTPAQIAQYNRNAILSASPARLLTMMYDRLLLDLKRAEAAQEQQNWPLASEQLLHAQEIMTEFEVSLNVDEWEAAPGLRGLYAYVHAALIHANIYRDIARTREAVEILEPLRQAWHEAAIAAPVNNVFIAQGGVINA